jgi:nitrogen fixation/metabolism regulation signal transduction histidine kinase
MEKGLVAGVIAILLGIFAVFVGWTIIGSLWGLIALLLAIYSYRKGHRMLGTLGILFACVGLIEGILVAGIVALFSVLTTSANTGIETTPSSPLTVSKIYSLRVLR